MSRRREKLIRGIPVAHGFASGIVFVHQPYLPDVVEKALNPEDVRGEVRRFRDAVQLARRDLQTLRTQVKREMGQDLAGFIDVQLALLTDEEVLAGTERHIKDHKCNAEFSYAETVSRLGGPIARSNTPFFRERVLDVLDVSMRVLRHLLNDELPSLHDIKEGTVLVAHDLPPSETVLLDPARVRGLVLEGGGKTSHTAIMAKAKDIPTVVGADSVCRDAVDGQEIIVDGYRGLVILNPTRKRLAAHESDVELARQHRQSLSRLAEQEAVTADGRMIDLSANIEFLVEARAALEHGARGIGLFRTEYIYFAKRRPPTEEEQFEIFAEVAKLLKPRPVIVRTFDLGGDKVIPGYTELNPFLGWRALRLCFDNPEMLERQIRAILRASAFGNIKMMFPMVSALDELRRARLIVDRCRQKLRQDGVAFDEQMEVGVMIETPAAAIMADRFAQECSFLSIGSNDLTQYTLAVDRSNEKVAELYDHFHPAVLQLLKQTVDAAHRQGIWVGMCGEFAADPLGILVLLGLGIDELSVAPVLIPEAKNIIRSIDTRSAAEIASEAMELGTVLEVKRLLRRELHRRFPKLAEFLFELAGNGDEDDT